MNTWVMYAQTFLEPHFSILRVVRLLRGPNSVVETRSLDRTLQANIN